MDPTHRDRQDPYRFWYPPRNITFLGRLESREVRHALRETGQNPRQILLQWARHVAPRFNPDSTPNPKGPSRDFQEGSPGSTANPKDIATQSTDKGGNSLTH